ncbi:hypothetical protein BDZ45DRAFT_317302 [Acephala macrosclerotiorum]|nr:hypothetical protein BDZ45DRAFT_317302 [Acephala macrosclerotiorum]
MKKRRHSTVVNAGLINAANQHKLRPSSLGLAVLDSTNDRPARAISTEYQPLVQKQRGKNRVFESGESESGLALCRLVLVTSSSAAQKDVSWTIGWFVSCPRRPRLRDELKILCCSFDHTITITINQTAGASLLGNPETTTATSHAQAASSPRHRTVIAFCVAFSEN